MTPDEAVRLLARWIAELQVDLAELRVQNEFLRQRAQYAADIRWWIENHTPTEIRELATELA